MMDLVQIMDSDTKKTAKVAKLKEWFVAREAQMAQLSLDGKVISALRVSCFQNDFFMS